MNEFKKGDFITISNNYFEMFMTYSENSLYGISFCFKTRQFRSFTLSNARFSTKSEIKKIQSELANFINDFEKYAKNNLLKNTIPCIRYNVKNL